MSNDPTENTPYRSFMGERLLATLGRWTVSEDEYGRYLWLRSKGGCQTCAGTISDNDLKELEQLLAEVLSPQLEQGGQP